MEWIGFYFEFRIEEELQSIMKFQKPIYGNSSFDGLMTVPWDFKAHPTNKSSKLITNDSEAISLAIRDYGCTGLILALGVATYDDEEMSFKIWHDKLKGKISEYEKERIKRKAPSRLRKTNFDLKKIAFLEINDNTLVRAGSFQEGFRNSDGSPRRPKVLLDLAKTPEEEIIDVIEFD
ncbi:MAG: hypothetical protein SVR81_02480 [Chloroflexota bacterium]|nr:hypothetical protein [Chloroflexota bacterium]